jgi:hypothetical protein
MVVKTAATMLSLLPRMAAFTAILSDAANMVANGVPHHYELLEKLVLMEMVYGLNSKHMSGDFWLYTIDNF